MEHSEFLVEIVQTDTWRIMVKAKDREEARDLAEEIWCNKGSDPFEYCYGDFEFGEIEEW